MSEFRVMSASRNGSAPPSGGMGFVAGVCAALLAFYVLLVGTPGAHEVLAGLGASLAAGLFALAAHRIAGRSLHAGAAALRAAPQVLQALAGDTVRVAVALVRAHKGGVISHTINASDVGERAVAILAASIAPNGFVIDDAGEGGAKLHRLAGTAEDKR
jgi:hypothetical protein